MRSTLIPCALAIVLLAPQGRASAESAPLLLVSDRAPAILAQGDQPHPHDGHGEMTRFAVGDLVVENPWARESVTRTGAAYLTIRNDGDAADRLVGVASEVAQRAELHASIVQDGVMRMRHVEAIEIPAHGEAALAPGGLHVMLIGLEGPLEEGGSFVLTLVFDDAGEIDVVATVEDIRFGGAGQHHDHGN